MRRGYGEWFRSAESISHLAHGAGCVAVAQVVGEAAGCGNDDVGALGQVERLRDAARARTYADTDSRTRGELTRDYVLVIRRLAHCDACKQTDFWKNILAKSQERQRKTCLRNVLQGDEQEAIRMAPAASYQRPPR
eukprot:2438981-Pleurochrysis_carterae.AAC.3